MPITSESRKSMKPRGKGHRSKILDAIKEEYPDEMEYLRAIVRASVDNPALLGHVLDRIEPKAKSTAPPIVIDVKEDATRLEKAEKILDAMLSGDVPADIGSVVINAATSIVKFEEATELKERIEKLEAMLNERAS